MAKKEEPQRRLPVRTDFYRGTNSKLVRKIHSGAPINAIANCTKHMRRNSYEADAAEVYDLRNGKLYAVMRRSVDGNVRTVWEAEYKPDREESARYLALLAEREAEDQRLLAAKKAAKAAKG